MVGLFVINISQYNGKLLAAKPCGMGFIWNDLPDYFPNSR